MEPVWLYIVAVLVIVVLSICNLFTWGTAFILTLLAYAVFVYLTQFSRPARTAPEVGGSAASRYGPRSRSIAFGKRELRSYGRIHKFTDSYGDDAVAPYSFSGIGHPVGKGDSVHPRDSLRDSASRRKMNRRSS